VDHGVTNKPYYLNTHDKCRHIGILKYMQFMIIYEGWNFNSGNYLFTTDTK